MDKILEKSKNILKKLTIPLTAIVLAFGCGAILILMLGESPIEAYGALFSASFSSLPGFGEALYKITPILLTGLAVAIAFRTGLFNIGAEGQLIVGSIAAVAVGWFCQGLPGPILIPLILISGALAGFMWASIAGLLKANLGIHEVITTIMLNYIALYLSSFLARTYLNPKNLQGVDNISFSVDTPMHARLSKLSEFIPGFGYSVAHTGIIIALIAAVVIYFLLFKTKLGYELRTVGKNPYAAEYGGINRKMSIIKAMGISGALAGIAGAIQIIGLTYHTSLATDMQGYGFDGIAVSLLALNHPLGAIPSAFLFGFLSNGARQMQLVGIPKEIVLMIQSIILIFISGSYLLVILKKKGIKIRRRAK